MKKENKSQEKRYKREALLKSKRFMKILYWPLFISALVLTRKEGRETLGARWFSLLLMSALMLTVGYVYHICLGGESLAFDIGLYVVLMAGGFLLPCFLHQPCWNARRDLLLLLVVALGAATILFAFLPPRLLLFADLSGAHTWATIPC